MKKVMLLAAFAAGYILGARTGRSRYDQIVAAVDKVRHDQRVRDKTHQVADLARKHGPVVAGKVTTAASAAASKVARSSSEEPSPEAADAAGAQGDLAGV